MASFIFFCTFSDYEGSSLCCGLDYVLILHLGSLIAHSPFHHKDITQKHWYSRFWGMISVGKNLVPYQCLKSFESKPKASRHCWGDHPFHHHRHHHHQLHRFKSRHCWGDHCTWRRWGSPTVPSEIFFLFCSLFILYWNISQSSLTPSSSLSSSPSSS